MPQSTNTGERFLSWALRLTIGALVAVTTWTVNKQLDVLDMVSKEVTKLTLKVSATQAEIQLLRAQTLSADQLQTVEIGAIKGRLEDHEGRIRVLERSTGNGR